MSEKLSSLHNIHSTQHCIYKIKNSLPAELLHLICPINCKNMEYQNWHFNFQKEKINFYVIFKTKK